jgi:hypothetical protein
MGLSRALQREIDDFYDKLNGGLSIRQASKGAFSQARAKINELGFKRLNQVAVENFYNLCDHDLWDGHRLLSVDGSTLVLPKHKSIEKEFGTCKFGPKADSKRSLATVSLAYDVLNYTTIDSRMAPYKGKASGERKLLEEHLDSFQQGDLLLLDRGYPAIWLFFQLMARGIDFCIRMRTGWWNDVKDFVASDENERIVYYTLPIKDKSKLDNYPQWIDKKVKCKLVKVFLEDGKIEVLCTSLLDEKYTQEAFKDLYHRRWNEEEGYKLLKSRIEVENFSGKTANAVKQDFHAKIFLMTLSAIYAYPIEERVKEEFKADEKRKYSQQINRTNSIACTKKVLIYLFLQKKIKLAIEYMDDKIFNTREPIRPDRSFERNHQKKKLYSMNYKPL